MDREIFYIMIMIIVIFGIATLITHFFPPKKPNWVYGFRTRSSSYSQETWDYAQKLTPKIFLFLTVVNFIIFILACIFNIFFKIELSKSIMLYIVWIYHYFFLSSLLTLVFFANRHIIKKFNLPFKKLPNYLCVIIFLLMTGLYIKLTIF